MSKENREVVDKTNEENGKGYQILSAKKDGISNDSLTIFKLKNNKKILLFIGAIIFWIIFIWAFLKSFYYGY